MTRAIADELRRVEEALRDLIEQHGYTDKYSWPQEVYVLLQTIIAQLEAPKPDNTAALREPVDERMVRKALQAAWNDFVMDTGCFPECFLIERRQLYADFHRGSFARIVASHLNALPSTSY